MYLATSCLRFQDKPVFAGFLAQPSKQISTVWNAASTWRKCWLWLILEDLFAEIIMLPALIVCPYRTFSPFSEGKNDCRKYRGFLFALIMEPFADHYTGDLSPLKFKWSSILVLKQCPASASITLFKFNIIIYTLIIHLWSTH